MGEETKSTRVMGEMECEMKKTTETRTLYSSAGIFIQIFCHFNIKFKNHISHLYSVKDDSMCLYNGR